MFKFIGMQFMDIGHIKIEFLKETDIFCSVPADTIVLARQTACIINYSRILSKFTDGARETFQAITS